MMKKEVRRVEGWEGVVKGERVVGLVDHVMES